MPRNNKKRTVEVPAEKLEKFRYYVLHAQKNGQAQLTLVMAFGMAMDLFIEKVVERYGEPSPSALAEPVVLRTGPRLG